MPEIKHIVYLMLENRSLDHALGWLYEQDSPDTNIPHEDKPYFEGLQLEKHSNKDKRGKEHPVGKVPEGKLAVPRWDPYEEYCHINNQLFESPSNPAEGQVPSMGGFLKDYETFYDNGPQILECYTPGDLPVLSGMAREFAVSDGYFASVPTQTNCNRAFAAAGNSLGWYDGTPVQTDCRDEGPTTACPDKNGAPQSECLVAWVNNRGSGLSSLGRPTGCQFNQRTFWNVLSEDWGKWPVDWMIYHSEGSGLENAIHAEGYNYTRDLMDALQGPQFDNNFGTIDDFYARAKAGNLPAVCFLEPLWGLLEWPGLGINGNDYHPPGNLGPGEAFLNRVYEALRDGPAWNETLLIVNFDEHGGTYDHVAPPWGARAPWAHGDTPAPDISEHGFGFDRFGVRVPLILVSPWIDRKVVFRSGSETPFDHTSVIATILEMMGVPRERWRLGARVDAAPTFQNVLTRSTPRTDKPRFDAAKTFPKIRKVPPNDIQRRLAASIVADVGRRKHHSRRRIKRRIKRVAKARTLIEIQKQLRAL